MELSSIYNSYISGNCNAFWKEISFKDFRNLSKSEQEIVGKIIKEALTRIDYNINLIFNIFEKQGFDYKNFGNINTLNQPYVLQNAEGYNDRIETFYKNNKTDINIPLFFASFCSFFKVVDFRGSFKFDVSFFLDALFIESFNNYNEIQDLIFEREFNDSIVKCCMFSPDQYIKEDESGDLGACILLSKELFIDNYVVNYYDDFKFTFIEYLHFCFQWGCMPSLYWASHEEQEIFSPLIEEIRKNIKPF